MRIDNHQQDDNLLDIAYKAHQRVAELILLFQDRLDKTKDAILNDQDKKFSEQHSHIKELEEISRRLLEAISSSKSSLDKIDTLCGKIEQLEATVKSGTNNKDQDNILDLLSELKPIIDNLSGYQKKKDTVIQKIVYAALGISMFVNFLALLVQLGAIPAPWGP